MGRVVCHVDQIRRFSWTVLGTVVRYQANVIAISILSIRLFLRLFNGYSSWQNIFCLDRVSRDDSQSREVRQEKKAVNKNVVNRFLILLGNIINL